MRKIIGLFLAAAFVLVGFSAVVAQERKKISQEEFTAVLNKSFLKGKTYRLMRLSKDYKRANNSLISYFEETSEYLPSGDTRSVIKSGREPEKLSRIEVIRIGQTTYQKLFDGKWEQYSTRIGNAVNPRQKSQSEKETERETSVEYFYLGKTVFKNQNAELYETVFVDKTKKDGIEKTRVVTSKKWFAADGSILRNEERFEFEETYSIRTFDYEYDPNIKIEAPVK